jgi:hypothetical protein
MIIIFFGDKQKIAQFGVLQSGATYITLKISDPGVATATNEFLALAEMQLLLDQNLIQITKTDSKNKHTA